MVKGGIEAGDLREARRKRADGADRRDMMRLMQWRQRDKASNAASTARVDQHRPRIARAAMDDAVAGGGEPASPPVCGANQSWIAAIAP